GVDPDTAKKLQNVITAIETAVGKFQTGASGIDTTKTSVNNAVGTITANGSGKMVTTLSTQTWPATSKEGRIAHDGLTRIITHLNSLKSTIQDQLPAITAGLSAVQTAQTDQQKSNAVDSNTASSLQGQINGLTTALAAIADAASPLSGLIKGFDMGGANCSAGIQSGDPLSEFDGTVFNMSGKKGAPQAKFKVNSQGEVSQIGKLESLRAPNAAWRSKFVTKLAVGYGIGAANNILSSMIAGHWLWGPFATGGAASTAAGYALDALPFPENAIAQTIIGQLVNVISYKFLPGGGSKSNTPSNSGTTKKLPNGGSETTQKQPDGSTETIVTNPDGSSSTTIKEKDGTSMEITKKSNGSTQIVETQNNKKKITNIAPNGTVTHNN
ncbi:MAG TPA: hypothetical protein VGN34_12795, partial [Ktedonobacteraceae bacterium]